MRRFPCSYWLLPSHRPGPLRRPSSLPPCLLWWSKSNATLPGSLKDSAQTGSKTDTPIRDLPHRSSSCPRKSLRDQGVTDMNQAMTNVSGATRDGRWVWLFANNYAIRGQAMRFPRDGYSDGTRKTATGAPLPMSTASKYQRPRLGLCRCEPT